VDPTTFLFSIPTCRCSPAALSYVCFRCRFGEPMLYRFVKLLLIVVVLPVFQLAAQQTKSPARRNVPRAKEIAPAKPLTPLETAIAALTSARSFEQIAISPDAKNVAWVEAISGKKGVETGNFAIYVSTTDAKTSPRRISA